MSSEESDGSGASQGNAEDALLVYPPYADDVEIFVKKLKRRTAAEKFVRDKILIAIAETTRTGRTFFPQAVDEIFKNKTLKPDAKLVLRVLKDTLREQKEEFVRLFLDAEEAPGQKPFSLLLHRILQLAREDIENKECLKRLEVKTLFDKTRKLMGRTPEAPPAKKQKQKEEEEEQASS